MSNTFYSAFDVLKKYITDSGYSVTNFSLVFQSPDHVTMWVAENAQEITHFVAQKISPTQFLIWGYGENYAERLSTSFDFADVNTPPISHSSIYGTEIIGE